MIFAILFIFFFFFNDTATTEIYTLSLHDALPISGLPPAVSCVSTRIRPPFASQAEDRKSTRLNSSHGSISYAVFCLNNKKKHISTDSICLAQCERTITPHAFTAH